MSTRRHRSAEELTREVAELRDELDRYQQATGQLLHQVDWCIDYLQRSGKHSIAKSLAKNRTDVKRRLAG